MANYNSLKNAGLLAPVANADLGTPTNTYGNLYMSGNVSLNGTLLNSSNAIAPRVASIAYLGNDTAAAPAGGATITLTGSGFVGSTVYIGGTIVASVSVVSTTQLTFVAPAKTAGSYSLSIVNSDGATASFVPGMQYSGVPSWSTSAGSLGSVNASTSASFSVSASSDSTVTYSVYSGSLPSGLSLNSSTGAITGTAPAVGSDTTYNFTVRATDSENQDTDRNFSISVVLAVAVEYLIVAGGGAGGVGAGGSIGDGGGGGAGGYLTGTSSITPGTLMSVTVGAGAGATAGNTTAASGSNSVFNAVTAYGGGGGGGNSAGYSGGSGGGGAKNNAGGAASPAGQGNAGGTGSSTMGAGGGGAGGAGSGGSDEADGGVGIANSISGASVTYAGGGGGGFAGTNSAGGGGTAGSAGTANTGGGGGQGAGYSGGKAGGSGIVILRYSDTKAAASATTGSPTITVAGGYRVYKFTSSGSITL